MLGFLTDAMLAQSMLCISPVNSIQTRPPTTLADLPETITLMIVQLTGLKSSTRLSLTNKDTRARITEMTHAIASKRIMRFMLWGELFASTRVLFVRFQKLQLTPPRLTAMPFGVLVPLLREKRVIYGVKMFIMRIHMLARRMRIPADRAFTRPASVNCRKILASIMAAYHPAQVFETNDQLVMDLRAMSTELVGAIHSVVAMFEATGPTNRLHPAVCATFPRVVAEYLIAFDAWKGPDEARIVERVHNVIRALRNAEITLPAPAQDQALEDNMAFQLARLNTLLVNIQGAERTAAFQRDVDQEVAEARIRHAAEAELAATGDRGAVNEQTCRRIEAIYPSLVGAHNLLTVNGQQYSLRAADVRFQMVRLRNRLVELSSLERMQMLNAIVAAMPPQALLDAAMERAAAGVLEEIEASEVAVVGEGEGGAGGEVEQQDGEGREVEQEDADVAVVGEGEGGEGGEAEQEDTEGREVEQEGVEWSEGGEGVEEEQEDGEDGGEIEYEPAEGGEVEQEAVEELTAEEVRARAIEAGITWRVRVGGSLRLVALPGDTLDTIRMKGEIDVLRRKLGELFGPERLARLDEHLDAAILEYDNGLFTSQAAPADV